MGRKKKDAPISFEALVLEQAPTTGAEFLAFIEEEIHRADARFRSTFFKSANDQGNAREQRLRLGRLMFWLKNGILPLGATEQDQAVYRKLAAKQPIQPHPFLAGPVTDPGPSTRPR